MIPFPSNTNNAIPMLENVPLTSNIVKVATLLFPPSIYMMQYPINIIQPVNALIIPIKLIYDRFLYDLIRENGTEGMSNNHASISKRFFLLANPEVPEFRNYSICVATK
jgi:hypothetical protein